MIYLKSVYDNNIKLWYTYLMPFTDKINFSRFKRVGIYVARTCEVVLYSFREEVKHMFHWISQQTTTTVDKFVAVND